MSDHLGGSILIIGALLLFTALTVAWGISERRGR